MPDISTGELVTKLYFSWNLTIFRVNSVWNNWNFCRQTDRSLQGQRLPDFSDLQGLPHWPFECHAQVYSSPFPCGFSFGLLHAPPNSAILSCLLVAACISKQRKQCFMLWCCSLMVSNLFHLGDFCYSMLLRCYRMAGLRRSASCFMANTEVDITTKHGIQRLWKQERHSPK